MPELKYKSTADIKVPKRIIDQVIGQDDAVEVMKKAAQQRRHVLLIGEPGTGKSMLGMALAELLPMEKLVDIVSFYNPNDENTPLIRTIPAGKGRELVARAKMQEVGTFKSQTIVFIIIAIIISIIPYYLYSKKIFPFDNPVIYAASMITSMILILGIILFINIGKRMGGEKPKIPKLIVDNYKRKQASFSDATGAHAGALLGDVLHDPFQCYLPVVTIDTTDRKNINIREKIDTIFEKNKSQILRKKERNYESIFLPKNELFVLGEKNGSISPVEVLSCNRHDHDGTMIKLTTSENKELIVTPEHKIAINKNGKITHVEAKNIKEGDEAVTKSEDIIIDEQGIINTYDERQQEQCKLYYQYLDIKTNNPSWGYKRIAKAMNQPIGKTRWWHSKKHIPVPIQTAKRLKEKGLLPLKIDNPKLPLIAKVLGATFGDGGIFENLNGIFLSSSNYHDTNEFSKDLQFIFGSGVLLNTELREGGEYGHSWCLTNRNRNIIRFFLALGTPKGNKANKELVVPSWIRSRKDLQDEFYGSLFGSELGVSYGGKKQLPRIEFAITGLDHLKNNRIDFLNNIINYLFIKGIRITNRGIDTSTIKTKRSTKNNKKYRFILSQYPYNLQKFIDEVKINYCNLKKWKLKISMDRDKKDKLVKYLDLKHKGLGAELIMKKLEISPKYLYTILNGTKIDLKQVEVPI